MVLPSHISPDAHRELPDCSGYLLCRDASLLTVPHRLLELVQTTVPLPRISPGLYTELLDCSSPLLYRDASLLTAPQRSLEPAHATAPPHDSVHDQAGSIPLD